ncbi:ABC transporter permease [Balneola vulgaris]|uniref:ABC transporter permease n=1 Tax=Balneola vulgaris TaxID=287535 RepID=UPI000379D00F|nr:ABC transporter permease [Balneola vulgaris]
MNIKETFSQATDSLKANKIRSSLTLLALVIGVFSVIVSTTAVAVIDSFFTNTMSILGTDVITVQKNPAVQLGPDDASKRNRKNIKFEDAEELDERMNIGEGMSPVTSFSFTKVSFNNEETDPDKSIRGGNSEYIANNAYNLEDGRNFNEEDIQYARKVAIIGKDIQTELFKSEYPLQKTIRIDGQPYTVIGVLESKGQIMGQSFDDFVLIPYTTGINVYGGNRGIGIQLRAPAITMMEETIDEVTGIMRVIRGVSPVDDNDFEVVTNDSLSGTFDAFTYILYFAGFAIGGITLLGAGIGVMNIMLVSVTERTKEIGVRKAVGATRKAIVNQFLMEAVFLCQLGGVIGLIAGIAAGNYVAVLIDSEPVIPIWSVGLSFFGMLIIGLVFGVYPAFKASKLDPIESLRYE